MSFEDNKAYIESGEQEDEDEFPEQRLIEEALSLVAQEAQVRPKRGKESQGIKPSLNKAFASPVNPGEVFFCVAVEVKPGGSPPDQPAFGIGQLETNWIVTDASGNRLPIGSSGLGVGADVSVGSEMQSLPNPGALNIPMEDIFAGTPPKDSKPNKPTK